MANNELKDVLDHVTLLSYGLDLSPLQMRIPGNRYMPQNDFRAWGVDMDERMRYFLAKLAQNLTTVCLYKKQTQWIDIFLAFSDIT